MHRLVLNQAPLNTTLSGITRAIGTAAILSAAAAVSGCSRPAQTFDSPQAAVSALVGAIRSEDTSGLRKILGSDADALLDSGDRVLDANNRAEFVRLYDEKNALREEDGTYLLEVGNSEWPLPIPVAKGDTGWYFDTEAGLDEMLSRRIGRNELDAIQVCLAIFDAQREYAAADHDGDGWRAYAQKFGSDPGKKNGLYWHAAEGEPPSPLGELAAEAAEEGYTATRGQRGPRAYHGYRYRILTGQGPSAPGGAMSYLAGSRGEERERMIGGFGVIAWPAEYGNSGLKSFLVSHHGVVYEKDLGDSTDRIARSMKLFDPGEGWVRCATANEQ